MPLLLTEILDDLYFEKLGENAPPISDYDIVLKVNTHLNMILQKG